MSLSTRLEAEGWNEEFPWRGEGCLEKRGGQVFKGSFFCRHDFSKLGIFLDFPGIFSVLNAAFFWETWATTLMNGPFNAFHNSLVASHHPWRCAARFHQFVFLTHLRLKPWRCSRLCWCPVCKEGIVYGKWFAHWQCTLCWHSPAAFTVWCINHVDRLTCSRCDTLRNHILKQLLKSQLDITWSWVPSTPRKVQNLSCQEIEQCTKLMNQMNVRNAFGLTLQNGGIRKKWHVQMWQILCYKMAIQF